MADNLLRALSSLTTSKLNEDFGNLSNEEVGRLGALCTHISSQVNQRFTIGRTATVERKTNETQISVTVGLDGGDKISVSTGVGNLVIGNLIIISRIFGPHVPRLGQTRTL